jgi:alpha-L-fucosidase 2
MEMGSINKSAIFLLFLAFAVTASAQQDMKMWYKAPAASWSEALPLGNGRVGAMVYGNPLEEKIQLNEATFWSGSPHSNANDSGVFYIDKIRNLQFEKKFKDAEKLADKYLLSKNGHGMMYVPVGNLRIQMQANDDCTGFRRELDLQSAIATTTFSINDVNFKREVFISHPDQVMVVRLTADQPGKISATLNLETTQQASLSLFDPNTIMITMTSPDHEKVKGAVKLNCYARVVPDGGMTFHVGSAIAVNKANSLTVYLAMRTNYKTYNDLSGRPEEALNDLNNAISKDYTQLRQAHTDDFRKYFDRSILNLSESEYSKLPTNERIANAKNDVALAALQYHFGRYLLISGSRPGGQPLTLQGLWNDRIRPPWDSKYTININTQMNYWPADVTNLSEMHEPLFDMVRDLSATGAETAKKMYGAKGWVAHHNTDLWRTTGVVDGAQWGAWPSGGAWLSMHIWQHYLYTGDAAFLQKNYAALKGAAEFYLSMLVIEPEHGWLVLAPSISPENSPKESPMPARMNYGCTMDNQLITDIFDATIKASEILGLNEKELLSEMAKARAQLAPHQIGKYDQLQEWMWDWDSNQENQSHMSQLYGFYPSNQLSFYRTPELAAAVKTSLEQRSDRNYTSWGRAWRVNEWARLHDGEKAFELLQAVMQPANSEKTGGNMDNLFSSIGPLGSGVFQIDANFGATAGIAEMLIQSHDGAIDILPALPKAWPNGSITGLKARGGFIIDVEWKDSKVIQLTIKSTLGSICRLRTPNAIISRENIQLISDKKAPVNPFYSYPEIAKPIFAKGIRLPRLDFPVYQTLVFDTAKDRTYVLVMSK